MSSGRSRRVKNLTIYMLAIAATCSTLISTRFLSGLAAPTRYNNDGLPKLRAPDLGGMIRWAGSNRTTHTKSGLGKERRITYTTVAVGKQTNVTSEATIKVVPTRLRTGKEQRRIFYNHVGKTGGEFVRSTIVTLCKMKGDKRRRNLCFKAHKGHNQSLLSKQTFSAQHARHQPHFEVQKATSFLWTIRHPASRVISYYYYAHPKNCIHRLSFGCNAARAQPGSWAHTFFFVCAATWEQFIENLATNSGKCHEFLLDSVRGVDKFPNERSHLFYNYAFYAKNTMDVHPRNENLVLRSEHMTGDLLGLERFLADGSEVDDRIYERFSAMSHGSEKFVYNGTPSPADRSVLCCLMEDEIKLYANIIQRAANFDEFARNETLSELAAGCSSSSMEELSTSCQRKE